MKHYSKSSSVVIISHDATVDLRFPVFETTSRLYESKATSAIFEIENNEILVDLLELKEKHIFCHVRYAANLDLLPKVIQIANANNKRIEFKVDVIRHLRQVDDIFTGYNSLLDF